MSVYDQADRNGYQVQVVEEEDGVLRIIRLTGNQLQQVKEEPVKKEPVKKEHVKEEELVKEEEPVMKTQKAHNCKEMGCRFANYNRMVRGDLVQSCGYCGKLDI